MPLFKKRKRSLSLGDSADAAPPPPPAEVRSSSKSKRKTKSTKSKWNRSKRSRTPDPVSAPTELKTEKPSSPPETPSSGVSVSASTASTASATLPSAELQQEPSFLDFMVSGVGSVLGALMGSASAATPTAPVDPGSAQLSAEQLEVLLRQPNIDERRFEGAYPRTIFAHRLHSERLAFGTEEIDSRSEVPWHHHTESEEILFCTGGRGRVHLAKQGVQRIIDFVPGVAVHVQPTVRHRIENLDKKEPLCLAFVLSPPLEVAQFQATPQ